MASPQLETVIQMLQSSLGGPPPASIQEFRATFDNMGAAFPVGPDVKCTPVDAGGVPAEWIVAPGAADDKVVLYLHGGGYVIGSITSHRDLMARLSRAAGAKVLGLNYRLAPENPHPAAVEDATAAYRWLLSQGTKPNRMAIGGDSAGGGLTLETLVSLRDAGTPLPAAAVCLSPWADMEGSGESMKTKAAVDPLVVPGMLENMVKMYMAGKDLRTPLASPLHADLKGLPPLLIQVGGREVLLDDSTRVAERAKAAGVKVTLDVWDEMIHVWHLFAPILPEGQQAIEQIGQFIRERIA
ncbi:MAG: alpha/beta hydrolase [Candidatus Binatia bacterium]